MRERKRGKKTDKREDRESEREREGEREGKRSKQKTCSINMVQSDLRLIDQVGSHSVTDYQRINKTIIIPKDIITKRH